MHLPALESPRELHPSQPAALERSPDAGVDAGTLLARIADDDDAQILPLEPSPTPQMDQRATEIQEPLPLAHRADEREDGRPGRLRTRFERVRIDPIR